MEQACGPRYKNTAPVKFSDEEIRKYDKECDELAYLENIVNKDGVPGAAVLDIKSNEYRSPHHCPSTTRWQSLTQMWSQLSYMDQKREQKQPATNCNPLSTSACKASSLLDGENKISQDHPVEISKSEAQFTQEIQKRKWGWIEAMRTTQRQLVNHGLRWLAKQCGRCKDRWLIMALTKEYGPKPSALKWRCSGPILLREQRGLSK